MGSNIQGCLGIGSFTPSFTTTPTLVSLPFAAVKAACGESHTIALTRNGKIYSWGEVSCLGYKARES